MLCFGVLVTSSRVIWESNFGPKGTPHLIERSTTPKRSGRLAGPGTLSLADEFASRGGRGKATGLRRAQSLRQ
jgi:hypothetical protein